MDLYGLTCYGGTNDAIHCYGCVISISLNQNRDNHNIIQMFIDDVRKIGIKYPFINFQSGYSNVRIVIDFDHPMAFEIITKIKNIWQLYKKTFNIKQEQEIL